MRPEIDISQLIVPSRARRAQRARLVVSAFALAALVAVGASMPLRAGASPIDDKRAEAARVADQVAQLDGQYDELQERFRGAQIRLDDINEQVDGINRDLTATERELGVANQRLVDRVRTVYQSGAANTRLINLAEAGSVTRFLDRMETIQRVSGQDADILSEIRRLRAQIAKKRAQLKAVRSEQRQVVADRRSAKNAMASRLAKRQRVLDSVNAEVRQMVAAEQARRAAAAAAAAQASRAAAAAASRSAAAPAPSSSDVGTALSAPSVPAPPASGGAASAASIAMGQIGVPYKWGGASPSEGFDCSGLVMWAFGQVGISLPHSTYADWNVGTHVSRDQLQTGDLVFFSGLGHMGIYVGGGSFVHAPHTGDFVKVSSLSGYYSDNYMGAVRV